MAKLKNIYVTWKDGTVAVVTKKPKPATCDGYFDPKDFDTSDPVALFLLWYSTLTVGLWQVPKMKCAGDVYNALVFEIDEFSAVDELDLFNADHDVSWRTRAIDEAEHARWGAMREAALAKLELQQAKQYPVEARLDLARRLFEELDVALIDGKTDGGTDRAIVAVLAENLMQWLDNTEDWTSTFRDWIVQIVTENCQSVNDANSDRPEWKRLSDQNTSLVGFISERLAVKKAA